MESDIVERLREATMSRLEMGWPAPHVVQRKEPLWLEAADEIERLRAELAAMRQQRDEAHGLIRKWRLNLVDVVEIGDYMDAMTSEARIGMNDADKRAFLEATTAWMGKKERGGA